MNIKGQYGAYHSSYFPGNNLINLERGTSDQQKLMKKGRGHLIHVSDFVEEENGRLVIHNGDGNILKDACCITFPGANGDAWWDQAQLLTQVDKAIMIFEEVHPEYDALFVFDQLSAHVSLAPDTLCAFNMNKGNGGKQRKQRDTTIPMSNPCPEFRGKLQKLTTETGKAKGLQQTLEEHRFKMDKKMKSKCSPVYAFESEGCYMACLLSKQDDFQLQKSLLEETITGRGYLCILLPKFHCKLNPIEMVCFYFIYWYLILNVYSIGAGANTSTDKFIRRHLQMQRALHANVLMGAQSMLSDGFSTIHGNSCWLIVRG